MNVSSASSANDLWKILENPKTTSVNPAAASGANSVTSSGSDTSKLSGVAKLFSKLEALSKTNPADFKKITAQIATQLQAAAKQSTGSSEASALHQLATSFQNASASGNAGDLFGQGTTNGSVAQPPRTNGHHHRYPLDSDNSTTASASSAQGSADSLSTIFSNALAQLSTSLTSKGTTQL